MVAYNGARWVLGIALSLWTGLTSLAIAEARAALTAFDGLGALRDAHAATAPLRSLGVRSRP